MARIRTIKPEYFRSPSLARCSFAARLTFAGLWCEADDAGRGVADPRLIKGAIWALDDGVLPDDVEDHLVELEKEHIVLYEVSGKRYFAILNWEDHQSAAFRRSEAKYPAPPGKAAAHKRVLEVEGKGREVDVEAARVTDAPASSGKQHGSTAPEEFEITPKLKEWATKHDVDYLDFDRETEQFLDHHRSKGNKFSDWSAAWRTWMRNADKYAKERKAKSASRSQGGGAVTRSRKDVAMGDVRAYRDTGQDGLADDLQKQIDAGEFDE